MNLRDIAPYSPFDRGPAKLNIPSVFGASPNKPVLYSIPATGQRPIHYEFEGNIPPGLQLDSESGIITGCVEEEGDYRVRVKVCNGLGIDEKNVCISIKKNGVGLTPLMGWSSWNAYARFVTQDDIMETANLLVKTGLSSFGYRYVNLDSSWQGEYGGKYNAIMPNGRFPDIRGMCRHIHSLGLKAGIYSTPMQKAWGGGEYFGCTTGKMDDKYTNTYYGIGTEHREQNNVNQWADWEFDYLKYDWWPCDTENAETMRKCLSESKRDFMYCITTGAEMKYADYWKQNCNSWRDTGDSADTWEAVKKNLFTCDEWAQHCCPGHFYDLDMLETGYIFNQDINDFRASTLTENEQLTAFSIRIMFPSPIQISCDLRRLTDFDLAMLCNDEILAVNQDALGIGAVCVSQYIRHDLSNREIAHTKIYMRPLEDGSYAVGMFNLGDAEEEMCLALRKAFAVRDLWAKKEVGRNIEQLKFPVPPHGVRILKLYS